VTPDPSKRAGPRAARGGDRPRGREKDGRTMRGAVRAAMIVAVLMLSVQAGAGISEGGSKFPARGTSGVHDAGNFTLTIDDDAGNSGWDTLEYPLSPSQDRLTNAYFGLGSDVDTVDFGKRGDLVTNASLTIDSPGNHTDEEGFCSFTGEPGQDFEDMDVVQRTFLNAHVFDRDGHTGRWLVVDYHLTSLAAYDDIYVIQMMDVDLGPPGDDLFAYDNDTGIASIHEGSTYIGLSYFNNAGIGLHGHNAGELSPDIFNDEVKLFTHMASPNNQTTSATAQNWYMDIVVKVPKGTFPGEVHVAFAILVGETFPQLEEALGDARKGMASSWDCDLPADWARGSVPILASFAGPIFPPQDRWVQATPVIGGVPQTPVIVPHSIGPGRNISADLYTTSIMPDSGYISVIVQALDVWGYSVGMFMGSFDCDNKGPDITFTRPEGWSDGYVDVQAEADDRGGSGTYTIFVSVNGDDYIEGSSGAIRTEGANNFANAFAIDNAGNTGPVFSSMGIKLDLTDPVVDLVALVPANVTEDTQGAVKVIASASDPLSGIDRSSARFRYGVGSPTGAWEEMPFKVDHFEGVIDLQWDALQDNDLSVEVVVGDVAGNQGTSAVSERIDPLNDDPDFEMLLTADEWETEEVLIRFNGSDPDGEATSFIIEYSTDDVVYHPADGLLDAISPFRFILDISGIEHEGLLHIRADATDHISSVPAGKGTITMDTVAPTISASISPSGNWSRTSRSLSILSSDGGSGVDEAYFSVNDTIFEGSGLALNEDGWYNVTAFVRDRSGNTASQKLEPFGIDKTPPEVVLFDVSPGTIKEGDTITVSFNVRDIGSGWWLADPVIIHNGGTIPYSSKHTDYILGTVTASFEGTGLLAGDQFSFRVSLEDWAGNNDTVIKGIYEIEKVLVPPPLTMTAPSSVAVGQEFELRAASDLEIWLHVRYPGTSWDWIVPPKRTEGDLRTYSLPAPYRCKAGPDGPDLAIEYWFEYMLDGANSSTYPDPKGTIAITGHRDRDGDGLEDLWEEKWGLSTESADLTDRDQDKDGLDLIEEMCNLTSPRDLDTDDDGMWDGYEAEKGTLPFAHDYSEDPDRDGHENGEEHSRRTDPRDPSSFPDDLPVTPWYWILIIIAVLLGIIGFFLYQLVSRRKLEKDLVLDHEEEASWDDDEGPDQ